MLSQPIALEAQPLGVAGQIQRIGERLMRGSAFKDRREIKD
jgi:hypothetical protein